MERNIRRASEEKMEQVLSIRGLKKRYAKNMPLAVDGISLECNKGEIVGLLGHNGAGKSTTIKCLEGMLPFEEGEIKICGYDIVKNPVQAKMNMGFVTDNHAVFSRMTGVQYLSFLADIYKVPVQGREEALAKLQEVFALGDSVYNLISSYSHGMKQKICMMGSLIHDPGLWVLDEPMTGLDPVTMNSVVAFMREYAASGHGIVFSSHDLATVAKLCDRVVIIKRGSQVCDIDIRSIRDKGEDAEALLLNEYI